MLFIAPSGDSQPHFTTLAAFVSGMGDSVANGYRAMKFSGVKQDCVPCARRQECLRTPEKTPTRQVSFFQGNVIRKKAMSIR